MLFLKQPHFGPILCPKSATTCQMDSRRAANSKLKHEPCNLVKTEIVEFTAPPQQPYKRGTIFLGNPVHIVIKVCRSYTWA